MNIKYLSPDFAVAGQLEAADVAEAAAMGFRAIVCNRPDGEEIGQPPSQVIQHAAEAAGLAFRDIPVIPGRITDADVAKLDRALGELPGDVLAYCRSGARAANLWTLVQESRRAGR